MRGGEGRGGEGRGGEGRGGEVKGGAGRGREGAGTMVARRVELYCSATALWQQWHPTDECGPCACRRGRGGSRAPEGEKELRNCCWSLLPPPGFQTWLLGHVQTAFSLFSDFCVLELVVF